MQQAAAYNAMAITASIREDFINGTHPGAIIFPVLYAESERRCYSVQDLLASAAIGLKLACYLNQELGQHLSAKGYRPTTVIGTIAAAGALTWLRYQSEEQSLEAMAAAAGSVTGFAFPFNEGTEEWLLQVPISANTAIMACNNVHSLSFHHHQFLTGDFSLGNLIGYKYNEPVCIEDAVKLDHIGVKRHPVNSFVQPAVEALLRGFSEKNIKIESISEITVNVPVSFKKMLPNLNRTGVMQRPNLSLLSIPISGAIAIIQKRLLFNDLQRANDREVQELAKKFSIVFSPKLENFDVNIQVRTNEDHFTSSVKTSYFYPTLQAEMEWIREQHHETFYWVEQYLNQWSFKMIH
jgi:2-methylcitrate dehydratase PrpD